MRVRGIVATLLIATAGLLGVGAAGGSDPPARPKPAVLISVPTEVARDAEARDATVDVDAVAAYYVLLDDARQVREYLAWQHEQDLAAEALRTSRSAKSVPSTQYRVPSTGSCAGDVECFLACTIGHESASAGVYTAISPGGTYRGAYQFDQQTWDGAVTRAGYGEYAGRPANEAPGNVQDAAATQLYGERGNQPWGGRC